MPEHLIRKTLRPAAAPLACLLLLWAAVQAQSPLRLAPVEGHLLLANGEVLSGKVTRAGDHYFVAIDEGEIRLKAADVDTFCESLDQAYEWKRLTIEAGKASDHLQLADWCLRQQLLGCAVRELRDALAAEPGHPGIAVIERRLEQARQRPAPTKANSRKADSAPTNDELDRMVRGMPPGAIEDFMHTVQPLLVNHCSSSGCHGPRSETAFSLFRIPPGRTPSRRLTQRNLHAVLQLLADEPRQSPLLLVPLQPHGGAKAAIFTNRQAAQYRQLYRWVHSVRGRGPKASPASVADPVGPLLQSISVDDVLLFDDVPGEDGDGEPHMRRRMPLSHGIGDPPADSGEDADEVENGDLVPADPFDAEIFNRRYRPR
ncbi:MAG: hypothetical protein WD847_05975 [Pirellulales bacterium]